MYHQDASVFPWLQKYFTVPGGNWWTLCKFSSIFWNEAHWHSGQLEIPWSTWNSPKINGNLLAPGRRNVNSISFPMVFQDVLEQFSFIRLWFPLQNRFRRSLPVLAQPGVLSSDQLSIEKEGREVCCNTFSWWYTMPEVLLMAEIRPSPVEVGSLYSIPLLTGFYTFIPGGWPSDFFRINRVFLGSTPLRKWTIVDPEKEPIPKKGKCIRTNHGKLAGISEELNGIMHEEKERKTTWKNRRCDVIFFSINLKSPQTRHGLQVVEAAFLRCRDPDRSPSWHLMGTRRRFAQFKFFTDVFSINK